MEMEKKAYDIEILINKLKSNGLDVAEDMVEVLVLSLIEWFEMSANNSENKYDDLILAAIPLIKSRVMDEINKIDGKK